ncbi:RNA polymerase sigma factor, partial [Pseudomonas sp. 2995-1]|uniref:RNA polymerase sigma factor n=1 Tax=Pseudomonas sp. 2995-1 TaxID=1712679 RepID=UPI000C3BA655
IARNIAIDQFRNKKRNFWKKMIPFEGRHEAMGKDTPESALQMNEEKSEIYIAIQSLKENYRDVLILRGIQELSVRETAEALNWSENKVRLTYL